MDDPRGDRVDRILEEWARERPELDVFALGLIGRLHRLTAFINDELVATIRSYGISEGEFGVLLALRRAGPPYERNPGQIDDFTVVTSGAITKRIDRLESAGLVSRRVSETDGRGRVVALTESGLALADEVLEAHLHNEQRLAAALTDDEADTMNRILRHWLQAFEGPAS